MADVLSMTVVDAVAHRTDVWFAHATVETSGEHSVRNFVFVAAGMYLWESVQYTLYDIELLYSFFMRLFLGGCRRLYSMQHQNDTNSLHEDFSIRAPFPRHSSQCGIEQDSSQSSVESNTTFVILDGVAQLAFVCLRLFTALALLSLLAFLNMGGLESDANIHDSSSVRHAIRLGSTVSPLVSFAISNLLLFLRGIAVWRECGSDELILNECSSQNASNPPSGEAERNSLPFLYHCGRSMAFLFLALTLHIVQYVFIGLLGSGTRLDSGGRSNERKLVAVTFAYFAFLDVLAVSAIVTGVSRWRNSKFDRSASDPEADVGNFREGHRFSPVIFRRHSCRHRPGEECSTDCGVSSYTSVSLISFARKSSAVTEEGDEEDDLRSNVGAEDVSEGVPRSKSALASWDHAWPNRVTNKREEMVDRVAHSQTREPASCPQRMDGRREKSWTRNSTSASDVGNRLGSVDANGTGSRASHHSVTVRLDIPELKPRAWAVLCSEGGRQGLLWALIVVGMKIGVFICVLIDTYPRGQAITTAVFQGMCFFAPALAIISIASGRLFLLITRASPVGEGFMKPYDYLFWIARVLISSSIRGYRDPPSPALLSPCSSFVDIDIVTPPIEDVRDRRLSFHQARPITLVHVDTVPSYVERRLYARRRRRELRAAAEGAVRTIGGSLVPPSPALLPTRSRRSRSKPREVGNETRSN